MAHIWTQDSTYRQLAELSNFLFQYAKSNPQIMHETSIFLICYQDIQDLFSRFLKKVSPVHFAHSYIAQSSCISLSVTSLRDIPDSMVFSSALARVLASCIIKQKLWNQENKLLQILLRTSIWWPVVAAVVPSINCHVAKVNIQIGAINFILSCFDWMPPKKLDPQYSENSI